MASLNWTTESQRWLKDIFEYIAEDNPQAASKVVAGIYERAQVLLKHPEIGYRYAPSYRDVRILLYGHFRIAYLGKGWRRYRHPGRISWVFGHSAVLPLKSHNKSLNADAPRRAG
jgi:plasmid stabilization system protein ParE